jgi:hypothetical protein
MLITFVIEREVRQNVGNAGANSISDCSLIVNGEGLCILQTTEMLEKFVVFQHPNLNYSVFV